MQCWLWGRREGEGGGRGEWREEEGKGKGGEQGSMHNYHLHDLRNTWGYHSWPHFQTLTSFLLLPITNYGKVGGAWSSPFMCITISKNFRANRQCFVLCSTNYMLNVVHDSSIIASSLSVLTLLMWENHRLSPTLLAPFPGSPTLEHKYTGRAWYLFSCEHDVITKGWEFSDQKGNVHMLVIQLYTQCSVCRIFTPH